uniref:Uncharacterized protein n=1 Tax=Setaria italica TaxID=4555 RepID=K3ZYL2_SETIT
MLCTVQLCPRLGGASFCRLSGASLLYPEMGKRRHAHAYQRFHCGICFVLSRSAVSNGVDNSGQLSRKLVQQECPNLQLVFTPF